MMILWVAFWPNFAFKHTMQRIYGIRMHAFLRRQMQNNTHDDECSPKPCLIARSEVLVLLKFPKKSFNFCQRKLRSDVNVKPCTYIFSDT